MAKAVRVIPASRQQFTAQPITEQKKRRTAGYARVSTDHEEQATSYAAQVEYYTNYIKGRDDWIFAGIYTDEGISATNTKHRDGFNKMVEDALAGKIDLIITKSVSRFARNTVDSLTTVRKLKDKGIEIYFEKENIWTLDSKGELLITIMSSLAQEESRSISENTTWGQRRRFADGRASVAYSHFLGYDEGFKINEAQAETVKLIYRLYLSGLSCYSIAKRLEKIGAETPSGGTRWHADSVQSILTNEKYKGDALLQKTYTLDFLTKKTTKNNGEIPQYYVEGHHEGIIEPGEFDAVQAEIQRRAGNTNSYSGVSIFSSKIVCAECGCFYGSKVWHSTDKYRKIIWRCNHKYRKGYGEKCSTPHFSEEEIKALFLKAMNILIEEKDEVLRNIEALMEMVADTGALEDELETVTEELSVIAKKTQDAIAENARTAQDQEEYELRYNGLVKRYEEKKMRYDELNKQIADVRAKAELVRNFIKILRKLDGIVEEFDPGLWGGMIEKVTVHSKNKVDFTFKGELYTITVG